MKTRFDETKYWITAGGDPLVRYGNIAPVKHRKNAVTETHTHAGNARY